MFDLSGKTAVVTGGGGVLGGSMAQSLAEAGVKVAVLGRTQATLDARVDALRAAGGQGRAVVADVLDRPSLEAARAGVLATWKRIDILVNAAGGNLPGATVLPDGTFFDLEIEEFDKVVALNLTGTVLPALVFGKAIADAGGGSVVNVSSMAASRPLSRVAGYSASKAAIDNLTRWLAVETARKLGGTLRVNAIAPGFFLSDQNRRLLVHDDGTPTERGKAVLDATPMGRFGEPEELHSTLHWLCADESRFVTGIVVPVDGGFSADSGV